MGQKLVDQSSVLPLEPLASRLVSGEMTPMQIVDQIETRFNRLEPKLSAFVPEDGDRFERLRKEAQELEKRHPDPARRPPLYGIPVGIKDIYHVEGFITRAGTEVPPENFRRAEGPCVRTLRQAGVLVLGKTVTTELAHAAPGPTRNPHNLDHTPGGSSSGSAAAVAAGLCPLAFGTQTVGSVIRPAAFCGVVGCKPSLARIPTEGIVPFSKTVDHVGFFTQDVQGAGLAASILCRKWNGSAHVEQPAFCVPEGPYLEKADSEGLSGFRETCRIIEAAGFRILRVGAMPDFEAIVRHHLRLIARDAYDVHRTWYAKYGALCREQTRDLFETGKGVGDDELAASRESCRQLRVELTGLLDRTAGCAFLSPSSVGPAPRGISSTGDPLMNLPWTHAGLPVVSLPSGVSASGLPLGLQLTGRFMEDETLMHCARLVSDVLSRESVASSPGLEAVPDDERQ